MTNANFIEATPAHGLGIDFSSFGADFHMPGLGIMTDLIDALAGPSAENAPAAKVSKLDNTPAFSHPVPGMKM